MVSVSRLGWTAMVSVALLVATPAMALKDGTAPQHDKDDRCSRVSSLDEEARVAELGKQLGGEETRAAWKGLRGLGESGCEAIVDWLRAGAPGETGRGVSDAHVFLLLHANGVEFELGLEVLSNADDAVLEKVAGALQARHAWVGPSVLAKLASSSSESVEEEVVELLMPDRGEGRKPLTESHHIAALRAIVTTTSPGVASEIADTMKDWMLEGDGTVPLAWSAVLVDCVELERRGVEWGDASGDAARVLATTELTALDRAIEVALEHDLLIAQEEIIDGLIDRLKAGDGSNSTVARLDHLAREADRGKLRGLAGRAIIRYGL